MKRKFKTDCTNCGKTRMVAYSAINRIKNGVRSGKCYSCAHLGNKGGRPIGYKHTEETKKKLSKLKKGKPFSGVSYDRTGEKLSKEHIEKIRQSHIGKKWSDEGKKKISGKNHYRWIEDRTKLQKYGDSNKDRRSSIYRDWRLNVWKRDGFKCRMSNSDCGGQLEAHHILSYTKYPELRYETNNGITLCKNHHPRRRKEEVQLIPVFKELVSVSN